MRVEELDIYALKDFSFALNNSKNLYSFKTVTLSLLTIVASVLINYQSISHLWLKRIQLPTLLSKSNSSPNPLTSTLICFSSNETSLKGEIPKIKFEDYYSPQLSFRQVSRDQLRRNRPTLASQIQSNFGCVDIAGHHFTQTADVIHISVYAQSASLFVEVINQNLLLSEQGSRFKRIDSNTQAISMIMIRTIDAVLKDTLKLNVQPQILTMLYDQEQQLFNQKLQYNNSLSQFHLGIFVPVQKISEELSWNKIILVLNRLNVGFIIGRFISWVSIISLTLTYLVSPLMNKYSSLEQTKHTFYLPSSLQEPSLPKFMIASLKKGIFQKQDKYVKLQERISLLKNIVFLLKVQRTLSKITPLIRKTRTKELFVDQESNFSPIEQQYSCSTSLEESFYSMNSAQQCPKSKIAKIKSAILHWLDSGSDPIAFQYKGKGHQSKYSFCVTIAFLAGFLVMLIMLRTFETSDSVQIYNSKNYKAFSYEFNYNQIIIVANSPQQIYASLIDGKLNTITHLSFSNSTNCLQNLTQKQTAQIRFVGQYIYCFQNKITFVQSLEKNQVISLYLNNVNFKSDLIFLFHFPSHPPNFYYNPSLHIIPVYPPYGSSYFQTKIKLTNFIEKGQKTVSSQFSAILMKPNYQKELTGINILLDNVETTIIKSSNSFFDILQNIWGFSIIIFTVILKKLTYYLNVLKKESKNIYANTKNRQNISIFMSKVNAILAGRHRQEINKMKYFLKSQMRKS